MSYHQPFDSVIFPFTVLSGFECDRKSLMKKTLCSVAASHAQDHIEKQLSSHVEPNVVFWDAGMPLSLKYPLKHCKNTQNQFDLWSMYC